MTRLRSKVLGAEHPALAFSEVPDALALTCWLHKDALIANLDREIDAEADDKAALTHEARQKAEAMGDLLTVERDEAALVWEAQKKTFRSNIARTFRRSYCLACGWSRLRVQTRCRRRRRAFHGSCVGDTRTATGLVSIVVA